jgi:hypothetical protein
MKQRSTVKRVLATWPRAWRFIDKKHSYFVVGSIGKGEAKCESDSSAFVED